MTQCSFILLKPWHWYTTMQCVPSHKSTVVLPWFCMLNCICSQQKTVQPISCSIYFKINPLTPNDHYSGRTAPPTSKCCILCIYSINICTEYFKNGINSPFFFSSKCSLFHNSNVFGSCIIHISYIECAKIKKKFRRQKVKRANKFIIIIN